MKKYLIAFLFVPFSILGQTDFNEKIISVIGFAETEIEPDIVILGMTQKDTESYKSESTIVKTENEITRFLRCIDASPENFTVDRYNANSKIGLMSQRFKVNKSYKIVIKNINLIDTISTKCLEVGMENVSVLKTDYSKMDSLQNALLAKAVINAQQKAQIIAKNLGVTLYKPYSINETQVHNGFLNQKNNQLLNEVAIIGYGVQQKGRIGSSISVSKQYLSKTITVKFIFQ
jgi:uncharacterized protein YggE